MHHESHTTLLSAVLFLTIAMLLPLQSSQAQTACTYSLGGCQCNCDGLSGLPPQSPPARSYDSFIIQTYQGAYGRFPTCAERRAEYWRLVDESYSSDALLEEARRFVSTRFETQQSYDTPGISPCTYAQTTAYEQRNPSCRCNDVCQTPGCIFVCDRVATEAFVGDLYKAFLQRGPDLSGQCFWSNNVCSEGRKKGIEAFKASIEFSDLVAGLYAGAEPCPTLLCRPGRPCDLSAR
jgi:hypothetical protein